MVALVEALNAEFAKCAPEYINDPKKAVYRIYRDTRFSPDKTPYKAHLAAIFPRRGAGATKDSSAGFYFHVSAKGVGVASGLYQPQPEQLIAVRTWLAKHHVEFLKAAKGPEKLMGKLQGSTLQRVPKGFAPDHPAADLLKMKQWLYWKELDAKIVTTPKLFAELVKRFRVMLPVLELMNQPLTQARPRPSALSAADLF